jgi:hypothetical protein
MLFMVTEHFKAIGERFRRKGRMLPVGVSYHASWIDAQNARCFQVMEAPGREALDPWIAAWDDLVDFDVVPVSNFSGFLVHDSILRPYAAKKIHALMLWSGRNAWDRKRHSEILKQLQSAQV